ncbi:hypothetical protein MTO96_028754 [Rhipicephalus appendiculatus]
MVISVSLGFLGWMSCSAVILIARQYPVVPADETNPAPGVFSHLPCSAAKRHSVGGARLNVASSWSFQPIFAGSLQPEDAQCHLRSSFDGYLNCPPTMNAFVFAHVKHKNNVM